MTDPGEEVFKQIVAMEVAEQLKHMRTPPWKRGVSYFLDHAFWTSLERIIGPVLWFWLGAISFHPLALYDIAMHWLRMHL
jgi:hypothetical protein